MANLIFRGRTEVRGYKEAWSDSTVLYLNVVAVDTWMQTFINTRGTAHKKGMHVIVRILYLSKIVFQKSQAWRL